MGWQRIMAVRSNSCVTGRRPRDNLAVRFRQRQRIGCRVRDTQPIRRLGHLWRYGLHGGTSVGTPWLAEEDMGQEEVPSLSICLSIYLKLTTNCGPLLRIKYIYFYKEVFHLFIEVRKSCLRVYNTSSSISNGIICHLSKLLIVVRYIFSFTSS